MSQPGAAGAAGAAVFGSAAEAVAAVAAGLGYLASDAADAGGLPAESVAGLLRGLGRAESAHVAARSRLLAAFTAQAGSEADGHPTTKSWLRWQTRVTSGAAAGDMAWMRRLAVHRHVAGALAAGAVSPSWAREVCGWTGRLPPDVRDDADQILLAALAGGADLADARGLFREMLERTAPPDGDGGGPGGSGDDGFADRRLLLDTHWRGAGYLTGNLTPECSAGLRAVLDSLGKKAGPEDDRTRGQRDHDALEEACRRLIASGCLPEVAGQPVLVQLHATLDQLRDLTAGITPPPGETAADAGAGADGPATAGHGAGTSGPAGGTGTIPAAGRDRDWAATGACLAGRAAGDGQPGWLPSPAAAEAYSCDAKISTIITGYIDPGAVAAAVRAFLSRDDDPRYRNLATGLPPSCHPGFRPTGPSGQDPPGQGPPGQDPPGQGPPGQGQGMASSGPLYAALTRYALDMLSGPAGLAARLRTQLPGILSAVSLPLDVGEPTATVPPHLRRAVALRDRHCAFPGCAQKPAACQVHHLIPRARGGVTALRNLALLCSFHHLIAVHRWGWHLALNADGTTTATSPDRRRVFHSHSPPGAAAA